MDEVLLVLPAVAVRVAVWEEVTAETVAVKLTFEAPNGTETLEGTVTDELLLERATLKPPLCAVPVNVTVHEPVPAAV
jgi:hypothetical protein